MKTRSFKTLAHAVLCVAVVAFWCAPARAAEMTVSAAASLTDAFTELKDLFEKRNDKLTVNTNFAASNPLLKQLQEGAPVDVFATADEATMDKAAEAITNDTWTLTRSADGVTKKNIVDYFNQFTEDQIKDNIVIDKNYVEEIIYPTPNLP